MAKAIGNQANINATEMKSIRIAQPRSDLQFEHQRRVESIEARR
jgi:hypothetical protein